MKGNKREDNIYLKDIGIGMQMKIKRLKQQNIVNT